ncbi:hypothetical protein H7J88_16315 [Mycolicibacterium flavescens]|nr:hypothetical protein [Mycolicibacterium flavescens]
MTGCTTEEAAPPPAEPVDSLPAGWPDTLADFSVTWTAEPGIELTGGVAVPVRAYLESYYLAYLTDDDKYLYPGFRRAVAENDAGSAEAKALWPDPPAPTVWVGTARHHLLRVEGSGPDLSVIGCLYSYGVGHLGEEGGVRPNTGAGFGPDAGISAFRIGLRAPDGEPGDLPPQQGPARAPALDVFDGWQVTAHQGGYLLEANWPDATGVKAECAARDDSPPQDRTFPPGEQYPQSRFPTLPAAPGWPDAAPAP